MSNQGGEGRETGLEVSGALGQGPESWRAEGVRPEELERDVGLAVESEGGPTPPRIYVASLADYNNGRLVGRWMDGAREPWEIYEDIEAMLASSPVFAEEWAIHDFEGFGEFRLHEYESIETVSRLALGIAEHGQAFAALAASAGTDEAMLGRFEEVYLGEFESLEEFARQLAEDLGLEVQLDQLSEGLRPYVSVDYETFGRDLGTELLVEDAPGGHVYLFDLRE